MATTNLSYTRQSSWQLPWLRVSLILRQMAGNAECLDEDLAAILAIRRNLAQRGWFN